MPKNSQITRSVCHPIGRKRFYVLSNGCHESFLDAAMLEKHFDNQGKYVLTNNVAEADLVVLLGCSVMQTKEDQTRHLIELIQERKNPEAKLIVTGCISKVRPELLSRERDDTQLSEEIDDLLFLKNVDSDIKANFPYKPYRRKNGDLLNLANRRSVEKSVYESVSKGGVWKCFSIMKLSGICAWILGKYNSYVQQKIDVWDEKTYAIKISTGCCGNCSYCSIKRSRGEVCSRPIEMVVEDFKSGLAKGYTDFALIGTDIGDYGKDRGYDLLDLLKTLLNLAGSYRIRLRNVNPRWLIPSASRFCELLASHKICYIESPIQSASDNILKLMNRRYTSQDYLEAIKRIRAADPDIFIKTQIIVGFPGETKQDFHKNVELFKSGLFDYIDVFPYTDRPNTIATALPDHLPQEAIMARRAKLLCRSLFYLAPKHLLKKWLVRLVRS